jgi:proteasome beta subunit
MSADDTALACMQALYDAADDDSATGGPDVSRRIYPVIAIITADGFERLTDEQAGGYAQTVIEGRLTDPDGPPAPLRQTGTQNGGRNALPSG